METRVSALTTVAAGRLACAGAARILSLAVALALTTALTGIPAASAQDPPDKSPATEKPKEAEETKPAPREGSGGLSGKVLLPATGEWVWWAVSGKNEVLEPPRGVKGSDFTWSLEKMTPEEAASASLRVLNSKTGNVARVKVSEADGGDTKLVEDDFSLARRLVVRLSAKSGKPVSSAAVSLTDSAGGRQVRILEAGDKGEAVFYDVPLGKASITAGSGDVSITQEVKLDRDRKTPAARTEIVLAGDVPTVAAEEPAAKEKKPAAKKANTEALLRGLVSLVLLAVVAFVVWTVLKNRKVSLRTVFEKAGIAIEEDMPPATPAATPAPAAPPLDPNMVGPAPTAAHGAASPQAPAPSGPKLVGIAGTYAGTVFPISGPSALVGREATCDIPLTQDSTSSRRHALIVAEQGVVSIRDEGSSNGTVVNGQKIDEPKVLSSGDEIQIGSTRFRYEA